MPPPPPPLLTPTSLRNLTLLLRTAPRSTKSYFQQQQYHHHHRRRRHASSSSSSSSTFSSHSSVSPTEIAHFNALASTWWDPHGPSRLLHLMNPLRHAFIRDCHASQRIPLPAGATLRYLDVGCGGGIFAESAARLASTAAVTAIDPSPSVLAVAKAHARKDPALAGARSKLTYLNTAVEELPVPAREEDLVDVLTVFEVVEHVQRPQAFLDVCARHVRPGGWMVLSTIARHWVSWVTTKVVAEEVWGVVPRGTHEWAKYVNEDELRGYFASKGGWNSWRCMGVVYVPGVGWREVRGSERVGNYFFAARRDDL